MFRYEGKYLSPLLICLIIILTASVPSIAQNKIDSLTAVLEQHIADYGNDKQAAEILTELYEVSSEVNSLASLQYIANAIDIYTQINDKLGIAKMQRYLGDSYFKQKMYSISMDSYMNSFEAFDSLNNENEKRSFFVISS